uniref:RWP-RK domain-containing protein n=1 Tax=Hanusia phi TaxID=3032 RepID=A0A7S0EJR0_9CRYP|mmetsp:Transcript_25016/g.56451  ORF Transcript_25016/g.56451 Transcript_25016/m.56451 type:complete len:165 (+) Transcript_25016:202-696(+)
MEGHDNEDGKRNPSPSNEPGEMKGFNTIFPRRKAGQQTRVNSKPVVLNEKTLQQFFSLPLHEAAYKLGISATAMKSACRKLGIKKWPYRSVYGAKTTGVGNSHSSSSSPSNVYKKGSYDATLSKDAELLAETVMLLHENKAEGRTKPREADTHNPDMSVSRLLN